MKQSFFIDREDKNKVEEEERSFFIKKILEHIGLPLDDIWPEGNLSIKQLINLKSFLQKYNITILAEGKVSKIYVDKELIATWKKPRYILHTDISKPKKTLYLEMIIEYESLFEKEMSSEDNQDTPNE